METIERYLVADGPARRGTSLLALIGGDACGFIAHVPHAAAAAAIGISEAVALTSMKPAFRQAGRGPPRQQG